MTSLALTYFALLTRNLPKLVDTADQQYSMSGNPHHAKAMQDFTVHQMHQLPSARHAQLKHQEKYPVPWGPSQRSAPNTPMDT